MQKQLMRWSISFLVPFALSIAAGAGAQTYDLRVLHRFARITDDGRTPVGGVQFDNAGNLYGTTGLGGAFGSGTIYKIARDGTETVLHSFEVPGFPGQEIGANALLLDSATGDIYGSTTYGGDMTGAGGGHGIVGGGQIYKLSADGTFTVLYAFRDDREGVFPNSVIRDRQGNFYGVLLVGMGTTLGWPVVFKLSTTGTFTVLHNFRGSTTFPDSIAPLVFDRAGNLYGITYTMDPTTACGTVYKLAPNRVFTAFHTFTNGLDGCNPTSLTSDEDGNLYGSAITYANPNFDNSVFKITPDGMLTILHSFPSTKFPVGVNPLLPINGTLYGSAWGTLRGEDSFQPGVLFSIAPDGTYAPLYRFGSHVGNSRGIYPTGQLALDSGKLVGLNSAGGFEGGGTVFSLGAASNP